MLRELEIRVSGRFVLNNIWRDGRIGVVGKRSAALWSRSLGETPVLISLASDRYECKVRIWRDGTNDQSHRNPDLDELFSRMEKLTWRRYFARKRLNGRDALLDA